MEYEIVKQGNSGLVIRKEVDITKEEYAKAKRIETKVTKAVREDLKLDLVSFFSDKIVFCETIESDRVTDKDVRAFIRKVKDFFKWFKDYKIEEPKCPTHDSEAEVKNMEDLEFAKKMLHDINLPNDNPSHICGALIVDTTTTMLCPEITGWGKMSYGLLKDMCELYVKTYGS